MTNNKMFDQGFKKIQVALKRGGFAVEKLNPEVSLVKDLKFHPNDYYFLKLDLEELTHRPVDIDQIYDCRSVKDLAGLLVH